jgi:Acetyltransferase (GNAT) domain
MAAAARHRRSLPDRDAPAMTDTDPISVRTYRNGDERDLVHLFQRAFGRSISEEHWRWKLKPPASSVDNVWLAVAGEQPVFQYAGIPTRFLLSQQPVMTMTSVDTMTAPEFRRRGLLTRVAGSAYGAWRDAGVAFVIGLPNEQWGSRAAALGWQPLFALQWLVRPLRPQAIVARKLNMRWLQRASLAAAAWNRLWQARVRRDPQVHTEPAAHAGPALDQIWQQCKADWTFSTIRDGAWVNWRFLSSPSRAYQLTLARRAGQPTGYSVHSLSRTPGGVCAQLAELFAARADDATRDTLLYELMETLVAAKAESVSTLAVPGTAYFRSLRRAGFFPQRAFSVQLVPLSAQLPLRAMLDPERWNLSGADFDVV